MTTFLGIYREPMCSPGRHRANDATILELVARDLEGRGHRVMLTSSEDAERWGREATVVFSMSRSPDGLDLLTRWEREGKIIVNRPGAVLETARRCLAQRRAGSIDLPATHVIPTARARRGELPASIQPEGWWLKGGDLYASRREDVRRVESRDSLDEGLDDFAERGITSAILQEHVSGREIKFYAAAPAGFFHWLDSSDAPSDLPIPAAVRDFAIATGVEASLEVFGGDIVVGADGRMMLIDLNDWPSCAPCREPAAVAIAHHLHECLRCPTPRSSSPAAFQIR